MTHFITVFVFPLVSWCFLKQLSRGVLGKDVLKQCSKFTGEHPCQSVIPIKLLATLLKSHFDMGALLQIFCIFSEHLFLETPLLGCFCVFRVNQK